MRSRDVVGGNVEKIAALFPHCVTERIGKNGKPELAIDFDKLRAELSDEILDEGEERYQFTWPDKRVASRLANEQVNLTLRPCREESVGKDGIPGGFDSENLYIEGDNLDVLKVLRETYLGRVKMIYIDPPYNTGNDFVYNDDFAQDRDTFEQGNGLFDDEGNQTLDPMQRNTEANGRFHTDWLNMIYPRLKIARDFLSENGVIFISIDDNEVENLHKICDEIFGEGNFLACIVWKRKRGRDNSAKWFSKAHEYCLIYAKHKDLFETNFLPLDEETKKAYTNPDKDPRGIYRMLACWARGTQGGVKYDFTTKDGHYFSERLWLFSKTNLTKLDEDNKLIIRGDNIYRKMFIFENKGKIPETLWDNVSNAANASDEIKSEFGSIVFDTPKPTPYLIEMLKVAMNEDGILLDFFSGSSTSAKAVMKLNAEDGGSRKFIMVQLPEVTDEKSEARKAGYANICEIGKERIRRAGKKIKEEAGLQGQDLDIGFRVLKLDSSNMEDVFYTPDKFEPSLLDGLVDNIKADRSGEDLLFQVMLDLGIELSSSIRNEELGGRNCWIVDDGYLIACFDKDVNETTIEEMAKLLPTHLVIRDASAATDNVLDNFDQIIESYSAEKAIKTHVL